MGSPRHLSQRPIRRTIALPGFGEFAVGPNTRPLLQLLTRVQSKLAQSAADMKLDGIESKLTPGSNRGICQPMPDTFDHPPFSWSENIRMGRPTAFRHLYLLADTTANYSTRWAMRKFHPRCWQCDHSKDLGLGVSRPSSHAADICQRRLRASRQRGLVRPRLPRSGRLGAESPLRASCEGHAISKVAMLRHRLRQSASRAFPCPCDNP